MRPAESVWERRPRSARRSLVARSACAGAGRNDRKRLKPIRRPIALSMHSPARRRRRSISIPSARCACVRPKLSVSPKCRTTLCAKTGLSVRNSIRARLTLSTRTAALTRLSMNSATSAWSSTIRLKIQAARLPSASRRRRRPRRWRRTMVLIWPCHLLLRLCRGPRSRRRQRFPGLQSDLQQAMGCSPA